MTILRNIMSVYQRDIHAIFHHRAALITVVALCFLPCLYTLVNVKAIWNPYTTSEVDNIPVAIVNKDQGAALRGKSVNFGNTIVSNLKKNHQIGWRFISANQAAQNLRTGKYYAEIEIPKNFSKKLSSIASTNPQKAQIIYTANTKNSPMGTKITENAATTLVNVVKERFTYEVNKTVFSYINFVGKQAGDHQNQLLNLKDLIINLGDTLGLATNSLGEITDTSNGLATVFSELKPVISASQSVDIDGVARSGNKKLLKLTKSSLQQSFSNGDANLRNVQVTALQLRGLISELNHLTKNMNHDKLNALVTKIDIQTDLLSCQMKPLITFLTAVNQNMYSQNVAELIGSLKTVKQTLVTVKQQVTHLKDQLNQTDRINTNLKQQLLSNVYRITGSLSLTLAKYNHKTNSDLTGISNNLLSYSDRSANILSDVEKVRHLNAQSLNTVIQGNQLIGSSSKKLENQLLQYKSMILAASNQLKLTDDHNIASVITILQNNPKLMGSSLASPFKMKNENIYQMGTFWAAFSPTYIALSIWVGCAMLVSVLRTTAPRARRYRLLTTRQEYIGKLLTFLTLSLIQTGIIVLSTVLILHVHVVNLFLMTITGVLSSLTFSMIVFTMVAIFGNLGKALAVMMVALQLAGSGAMYPVQLNPLIFRILQPMFPFTYSVSGFREAIAGPNIETVVVDFFILTFMLIFSLLVGLFLKSPLKRMTQRLQNDFERTGIGN